MATSDDPKTIDITPNFSRMFDQFLRDASLHAGNILRHAQRHSPEELSRFRSFIVALNIAVQSCVDAESLLRLREEMDKISAAFVNADDRCKASIEREPAQEAIFLGTEVETNLELTPAQEDDLRVRFKVRSPQKD